MECLATKALRKKLTMMTMTKEEKEQFTYIQLSANQAHRTAKLRPGGESFWSFMHLNCSLLIKWHNENGDSS